MAAVDVAEVTVSRFPELRARVASSMADLQVVFVESRALIAQSARLCRTARRVCGGSDLDSPFVVELILKAPMCLPCVARKTGMSESRVADAVERTREFMVVEVATTQCAGCLEQAMTYRISAQKGNAPAAAPARPTMTLSETLWRFLESHRGRMFCTPCIANALFATKRIDRAVIGAEGRGARRQYGTCASCGKERLLCGLAT
jgi:hypothetical protein